MLTSLILVFSEVRQPTVPRQPPGSAPPIVGMTVADPDSLMREVIAAIREGLPDADQMQPGQVFQHLLAALHDCSKKD